MKKVRWVCFPVLLLSLLVSMTLTACKGMYKSRMIDYYCDDNNYVELTGVVVEKQYYRDEPTNVLSIRVTSSNNDFYMYGSDTGSFCLYFPGLLDKLCEGDTIIFTSAPRVFYDGQKYPIVSLSKDEQELLSFTDGKSNYIEWIKSEFD